jgi:hypothetical protein
LCLIVLREDDILNGLSLVIYIIGHLTLVVSILDDYTIAISPEANNIRMILVKLEIMTSLNSLIQSVQKISITSLMKIFTHIYTH